MLAATSSLTECNVRGNNIDSESATMLAKVGTEKRIMLFGIKHGQVEANFVRHGDSPSLGPVDAILIASDLQASGSITSLNLSANYNLANDGRDMTGITALSDALRVTSSITSVNVLSNHLDVESANLLLKVKAEKPNLRTLCGLTHNEAELDLRSRGLGPGDAKLLAPEILAVGSITELNLEGNSIKDEGVTVICEALLSNKETKLASLNVRQNGIGPVGAKAVAAMAAAIGSITEVREVQRAGVPCIELTLRLPMCTGEPRRLRAAHKEAQGHGAGRVA